MSEAAAEYIAAIGAERFESYIALSSVALVAYNHLITLADEVHYFSRERRLCPSLLYLSNRYIILAGLVLDDFSFWSVSRKSQTSCVAGTIADRILDIMQYLPPAAFSGLRMWALARRLDGALLVFLLSLSPMLLSAIYMWRWETIAFDRVKGCTLSVEVPEQLFAVYILTARVPLIVAEITVLVVTWVTQFRDHRLARTVGRPTNLFFILLRDGSVYFLIVTALSLLRIALSIGNIFAPSAGADATGTFLSYFINPITAILLDRFLIDLREAADSRTGGSSTLAGGSSSVGRIELSFVGSIAVALPAPLAMDRAEEHGGSEERGEGALATLNTSMLHGA